MSTKNPTIDIILTGKNVETSEFSHERQMLLSQLRFNRVSSKKQVYSREHRKMPAHYRLLIPQKKKKWKKVKWLKEQSVFGEAFLSEIKIREMFKTSEEHYRILSEGMDEVLNKWRI